MKKLGAGLQEPNNQTMAYQTKILKEEETYYREEIAEEEKRLETIKAQNEIQLQIISKKWEEQKEWQYG
jgi:hypothetical protein